MRLQKQQSWLAVSHTSAFAAWPSPAHHDCKGDDSPRGKRQVARNRPAKRAIENYANESGGPIRSMPQSRYNFASAAKS